MKTLLLGQLLGDVPATSNSPGGPIHAWHDYRICHCAHDSSPPSRQAEVDSFEGWSSLSDIDPLLDGSQLPSP
jgi:hypothetical protein